MLPVNLGVVWSIPDAVVGGVPVLIGLLMTPDLAAMVQLIGKLLA